MSDEAAERALAGEQALLRADVRRDRDQVEALLHPLCEEVGASGVRYSRSELLDLVTKAPWSGVRAENWATDILGPGVALVTYDTWRGSARVHRSSIWVQHGVVMRLRHHQATPAGAEQQ